MPTSIPQTSFTGGEFSPSLYGRIDLAKYYTGLKTCRNFIVRPFGGIANRPGWKYIGNVQNHAYAHRLIPFQFSTVQSYVLVFGHLTMRIVKDGGVVVYPVGHPSAGNPVEIVTIYPASVLRRLSFSQSADVMTICHPDYPPQQLSRTDHHLWSFAAFNNVEGPFDDLNIDTAKTVRVSGVTGTVTVTASASIFTAGMVGKMLFMEQSPDSMTKKWEVSKAILVNDIRRAGANYYKAVTSETTGTARPDHLEGNAYDGDPGVGWQYLHSGNGIVLITGYTSGTVVTGTVLRRLPDSMVTATAAQNIAGLTPGTPIRININAHGYSHGDTVTVAGVTGTTGANGTWQVIVIDANNFDLSGSNDATAYVSGGTVTRTLTAQPSYKWALESWGDTAEYPGCTAYYQQRQIFGGSTGFPQTGWLSRTKGYLDFGVSSPALDDDSITLSMATREVNEIRHFIEVGELIALTSSGPFMVRGGQDGTITPSAVSVKGQGKGGASFVPPLLVGSQALYVQEKGQQVRSLGYSFTNDQFSGTDLTIASAHLFSGRQIVEWVYQTVPFSCVWAVRDDGVLLGLTYMPEQEVVAWHRHDTDGYVESVACVSEGTEDAVYLIVRRTIQGQTKRYIERMHNRQFTAIEDAFFVDSGLTYDGAPATTFSGLGHLEGETVSILADGNVMGQQVVTGGQVVLQNPASVVHVGLPIISDAETLAISVGSSSIRDKQKLINRLSLIVEESSGVWAGADASNLFEHKQRENEPYDTPVTPFSGLFDISISATWNKQGHAFIRQQDPLPISILSIIPEVTTGGA